LHSTVQLRSGHKDDLQHPKAHVGDGKGDIIAHVLTTRLLGVTGEDQDAEDEQDREPHFSHHRGVLLGAPVHFRLQVCKTRKILKVA
uniref:Uncharacterized protein n=1 Tax=Mastacembelus armatus TaxID=205130 RepID=A0A7N8X152_9TELE